MKGAESGRKSLLAEIMTAGKARLERVEQVLLRIAVSMV